MPKSAANGRRFRVQRDKDQKPATVKRKPKKKN